MLSSFSKVLISVFSIGSIGVGAAAGILKGVEIYQKKEEQVALDYKSKAEDNKKLEGNFEEVLNGDKELKEHSSTNTPILNEKDKKIYLSNLEENNLKNTAFNEKTLKNVINVLDNKNDAQEKFE